MYEMTADRDPRNHLPLAPHSFQILLSLLEEDRHGYSIIKDIESRSRGRMVLGTSTAYAAIKRMEKEGLLEASSSPPRESSSGPKRRYWAITEFGRRVARAEGRRIAELHEMVVGSSLLEGPPTPVTKEAAS
jgi:DNA-binding PadR family transcriptional regulator